MWMGKKRIEPLNRDPWSSLPRHLFYSQFSMLPLSLGFQWHDGFVETSFDVKVALIYVNLWVYVLLYVCIQSLARLVFFSSLSPLFNRSVYYCYYVLENCLENESKDSSTLISTFYSLMLICFSFQFRHGMVRPSMLCNILEMRRICDIYFTQWRESFSITGDDLHMPRNSLSVFTKHLIKIPIPHEIVFIFQ